MDNRAIDNQSGFTLIELCVVMVIVGLMLAGFIQAYTIYNEKQKLEKQEQLMVAVNRAIEDFVGREARLPCPAPMAGVRGAGANQIRFNEEDCNNDGSTSNLLVAGTGGNQVMIGKFPAATLEVSNDLMKDVHDNYLIYAVTTASTDTSSFASADGAIRVIQKGVEDDPGLPGFGTVKNLLNHPNVQYIVVSSGSNGFGAYAYDGAQAEVCDDANNDEQENCDGDAVFKVSVQSDRSDRSLYYDDKAYFTSNAQEFLPIDPAACQQQELFNSNVGAGCPDGWQEDSSLNDVAVVDTTDGEGKYFNIDPDTGDYYFTSFKTPYTTFEPYSSGGFSFNDPKGKAIKCRKSEGNSSKTRCSSKKVRVTLKSYGGGAGSAQSNPERYYDEKKCPAGYKAVHVYFTRESYEKNNGDTNHTNKVYQVCSSN